MGTLQGSYKLAIRRSIEREKMQKAERMKALLEEYEGLKEESEMFEDEF